MKNNAELQKAFQDAIKWESLLQATEIGVTVKDGVVTLTCVVDNYTKQSKIEEAAKKVASVNVVRDKIEVKFSSTYGKKGYTKIADEVLNAFKWNWQALNEKVKVKVENGSITLEGELEYNYQRDAPKDAVKNLLGASGISNNISVKSTTEKKVENTDIESALKRN